MAGGKGMRHHVVPGDNTSRMPIDHVPALYIASGEFRSGTVLEYKGRSRENVARVLWLMADCDANVFVAHRDGMHAAAGDDQDARRKALADAKARIHALSDAELESLLVKLRRAAESALMAAGVPAPTAWVFSGYGLYMVWSVSPRLAPPWSECGTDRRGWLPDE